VSIWVVATFVVLGHYNVNTAALITGAGAIGIFFSIAGKDVLMDIYVGMMALLEDQYRVGDEIEINKEHSGIVEEITLRIVKLRDENGGVHIVPHSLARSIVNKTYDYAIASVEMSVPYSAHNKDIIQIANSVGLELSKDENWSKHFIEPMKFVATKTYDNKELKFKVTGRVKPGKQDAVSSEYKIRMNEALKKAGVKLLDEPTNDKSIE
jgi:small conductance mechanosensitive channel